MRRMGDILLDRGLIKKEELEKALELQKTTNKYLGQILVEMNIISEEVLTDIQSSLLGLKVISTKSLKIHPKIIQFIPQSIAIKYRVVPIYIEPNGGKNILCMVTSEEPPAAVINKMSEKLNVPIKLFLATYSEVEELLVKHYNKQKEELKIEKKESVEKKDVVLPPPPSNDFEEEILTGDIIEDDEEELSLSQTDKSDLPELELKLETNNIEERKEENLPNDVAKEKVNGLKLDFLDENDKPKEEKQKDNTISEVAVKEEEPPKKLNFLEAFKNEDSYVFEDKEEEYISVEIPEEDTEEIEELDVSDVDLFDDVIDDKKSKTEKPKDNFSFELDDANLENKTNKNNKKTMTPPPPVKGEKKDLPLPVPPKKDPGEIDKSGFPPPKIRKFKDESENETNPGTKEKISLNEKKATEEWLKKNKNRDIPDLDFIFGDEEAKDPLNNADIDKIVLSEKLKNLKTVLIDYLNEHKVKKTLVNKFKKFFDNLERNPSDLILVSMLEMILTGTKPDLELFLELILRNINNADSKNK